MLRRHFPLTLCLLVAASFVASARAQDDERQPTHGTFIASDGLTIHYLAIGRGVPVVLVHGYTGSAEGNWFRNGIAPALAKNHYVVALDCRGHGDSDKPDDPDRYGDLMWRDVIELMDHLNLEQAHIHGYSMGGGITAALLARYPERFLTAAFGGSGVRETEERYKSEIPADKPGPDPQEAEALATLRQFAGRSEESTKALAAVRASYRNRTAAPLDLPNLDVPILAINGEFDAPNAKTHRLTREAKNFTNVILPGKSHLTAIMAGYMPPEYLAALVEFINANDP